MLNHEKATKPQGYDSLITLRDYRLIAKYNIHTIYFCFKELSL